MNSKTFQVLAYAFDGFEMLDMFGPLEMFSALGKILGKDTAVSPVDVMLVSLKKNPRATGGPQVVSDFVYGVDALPPKIDLFLVPGGKGTRADVMDQKVIEMIQSISTSDKTEQVMSVCTGSALLAKAGLLDGRQATSNKLSFEWVKSNGPNVQWKDHARFVFDGKYATSSGVAAGTDLSLAIIQQKFGSDIAKQVAIYTEYVPNLDPDNDPFSKL